MLNNLCYQQVDLIEVIKFMEKARAEQKLNFLLTGGNENLLSQRFRYLDLIFTCVLSIIFSLFVPVVEWPDAMDHISRRLQQETWYPFDIFSSFENLYLPTLNNAYSFFSDQYMYRSIVNYFLINLERLPVVLALVIGLHLFVRRTKGSILLFCPPLVYSIIAPSQEVVGIFILLVAVALTHKYVIGAVILAVLSMAVDRSMIPNATFLCLYLLVSPFRTVVTDRKLILLTGLLLLVVTSFLSPLDLIDYVENDLNLTYSITSWDIISAGQVGENKYLALVASTMGLYGWLSIRPFPFWIYYPAIAMLFVVGFATSKHSVQSIFISLSLVSFLVLWLLPSLGQARYYPLQTLAFWSMVISGAQVVKINLVGFCCFVTLATAAGCFISIFNAI